MGSWELAPPVEYTKTNETEKIRAELHRTLDGDIDLLFDCLQGHCHEKDCPGPDLNQDAEFHLFLYPSGVRRVAAAKQGVVEG